MMKKIYFIYFATIFLLLNCLVYSQETIVKLWTKQIGTAGNDYGKGVATDASGNIYVTGLTRGRLDGNTNAGETDIFLVKYDSAGNKIWTRQLGTANWDEGRGVATDALGNIYVTGRTFGSLDGNKNAGGGDIFLVKYDSVGKKLWTKQLGTADDEKSFGVTTDASGNIYVTGETYGSLDGNTKAGYDDIFLVKYDSAGKKLWTKQLGTADEDMGKGVATDAKGNIYVTGWTQGSLDGNKNAGYDDIFLVKYDSRGEKIWTRQLGTADDDEGEGVATDASGNIYVTGYTGGSLDGNRNAGDEDIFLVKYDSVGKKLWTKQLGTGEYDEGEGVATDAKGNIYVTGKTDGNLDGNTNAGWDDIFLVKFGSPTATGTTDAALKTGTEAYLPGDRKEPDAQQAIKDITEDWDIVDALKERKIEVQTKGSGIESVSVRIRKLVPYSLTVRIPVGTFFVSANSSVQNMVTTAEEKVRLTSNEWNFVSLDAACANRTRDIPGGDDIFTVERSPNQAELLKVLPVMEKAGVSDAIRQAAVWIITDNADYKDLGILVSRSQFQIFGGTRRITEYEAARAMKILDEAGINIKQKAIWRDRETIISGLKDDALKTWLKNKE